MDERVAVTAEAIRVQLRENVGAPGLRAIKAVLLLDENDSMLVSDAVRDCGTSKASIRKYRELKSALNRQHESSILAGGSANPCLLSPPSSETDHTSGVRPFYCPFGVALFRNRDCLLLCAWTGYCVLVRAGRLVACRWSARRTGRRLR